MAVNRATWRRHLQRGAINASTPLEQLPPPHYGPGHNLPPPGSDLDAALRRDINGHSVDFVNQPRVDVDPNIGLSLMMGLTDKLTVRRLLTTDEMRATRQSIDAINPTPPVRNVIDHIDRERMKGNSHTVIMLRFPGVHKHGQKYNPTLGAIDADMIEMPVIIDIRENALGEGVAEEWRADEISYTDTDIIGKSAGDKVAQAYGYATAQDMQNSRPLGLNNNWLRRNEGNGKETKDAIRTIKASLKKIDRRLSNQENLRNDLLQKLSKLKNDGPNKDMVEAEALVAALREEAKPLTDQLAPLEEQEQRALSAISMLESEEQKAHFWEEIKNLRQQMHPLHVALAPINTKINRALRRTADVLEQNWQGQLATREDEIARLQQLQTEGQAEITRLENITPVEHFYADSDHNPVLFTMKVVAANPRDYERVQKENPNTPMLGKPKAIQQIYRHQIFPYALDNRPNGWLKDALGTTDDGVVNGKSDYKPDNSYIRATRRYFMHLFEKEKDAGGKWSDFKEFAEDPNSVLGTAISTLNTAAMSDRAIAASWRDNVRTSENGARKIG